MQGNAAILEAGAGTVTEGNQQEHDEMSNPDSAEPQDSMPLPDTPNSQREQAADIARAMEQAGKQVDEGTAAEILSEVERTIGDADQVAAAQRVAKLRARHPNLSTEQLIDLLVRDKVNKTGMVGAATTGAGLIPGIGTLASLTVGVAADISATFKLQSELVMEIAAAYNYRLSDDEKQRAILLVTGLSAGANQLTRRVGTQVAGAVSERVAQRWVSHALPIIGVAVAASTNALSTYIVGERAKAYFGRSPEAMGNWMDNLRAITGVDERKIQSWIGAGGQAIASGSRTAASVAGKGATGLLGFVRGLLTRLFALIAGIIGSVFTFIRGFFGGIFALIGGILRGIFGIFGSITGLFRRKPPPDSPTT